MSLHDSSTGFSGQAAPPAPETAPQLNVPKRNSRFGAFANAMGRVQLARVILGAVLGSLFVLTWVGTGPAMIDTGSPTDWKSELAAASVKNEVNNVETTGAPQQSVVNGWYANDIAAITASQNTYIAASSARNGTLLMLLGLGVAGELIIRGLERARHNRLATA